MDYHKHVFVTRDSNMEEEEAVPVAAGIRDKAEYFEQLVLKRSSNLRYLKTTVVGDSFWFQCAQISKEYVDAYQEQITEQRLQQYFLLGVSLARLLQGSAYKGIIHAMNQLFEEFEYHFASAAIQSMKYVMARSIEHPFPEMMHLETQRDESGNVRMEPRINKFLQKIAYQYLIVVNAPFLLDFKSVILSLLDSLELVYNRLHTEKGVAVSQQGFDALLRVDAKVKHYIVNPLAREFTELSVAAISTELQSISTVWT